MYLFCWKPLLATMKAGRAARSEAGWRAATVLVLVCCCCCCLEMKMQRLTAPGRLLHQLLGEHCDGDMETAGRK